MEFIKIPFNPFSKDIGEQVRKFLIRRPFNLVKEMQSKNVNEEIEKPFLEIKGSDDGIYNVKFTDEKGIVRYENNLPLNRWVKLNQEYYTKWNTQISKNGKVVYNNGKFIEIAKLLEHHKVDYLGVAFADEGISLKNAGIILPIMVLNPETTSFFAIIQHHLEPEIYSLKGLNAFLKIAEKRKLKHFPIHIKLDTGMHRLGFEEENLDELIATLKGNPFVAKLELTAFKTYEAVVAVPSKDPVNDVAVKEPEIFIVFKAKSPFISGVPEPEAMYSLLLS